MLDQEQKLREAEYFYAQMIDSFQKELYDPFTYCMSAFLSAARSILQYTYEQANANGRINDYNNLISPYHLLQIKQKRRIPYQVQPERYSIGLRIGQGMKMFWNYPNSTYKIFMLSSKLHIQVV